MSSSEAGSTFRVDPLLAPSAFAPDVPSQSDSATATGAASRPLTLEARIQAAHEEGRAAARAELPLAEAEALSTAARALAEAAQGAVALRSRYLREQREGLIDLALEIAAWVVRHHVEADRQRIADAVDGALGDFDGSDAVTLHLAPGDLAAVRAGGAESLAELADSRALTLAEDERLRSGDYRLVAGERRVDGSVAAILQRLREGLVELTDAAPSGDDS